MPGKRVDIAIPVYNEEKRLRRGITTLYDFCHSRNLNFSITIADNGSVDHTRSIAIELQEKYPGLKYLAVGKKGVGLALREAWARSSADIVGYMDVDLSTDLKHLPQALEHLESGNVDIVTGSRLIPGAEVVGRTLKREISSRSFNLILKNLLGIRFSDGMCGFKFMRTDLFREVILPRSRNLEWFFNTEILVIADWLGYRVLEVPVRWVDDPNSKVKVIPLARKYLNEILRMRRERKSILKEPVPTNLTSKTGETSRQRR